MKYLPVPIAPKQGKAEVGIGRKVANGVFLGFCVICPPFVVGHALTSATMRALNKPQTTKSDSGKKGFSFGTWNAGGGVNDYLMSLPDRMKLIIPSHLSNDETNALTEEHDIHAGAARERLLPKAAAKLASRVDVCALQEIQSFARPTEANKYALASGYERPDILEFKKKEFEIHGTKNKNGEELKSPNTVIAINPKKFENIENKSNNTFALVVATEKETGKRIAFVSATLTGFGFDTKDIKNAAEQGDQDLDNLLSYLNEHCRDCDTVLVGSDTNTAPEIYKDRHDKFTAHDFQTHRTNQPTERNNTAAIMPDREIDYVFLKSISSLKDLFFGKKVHVAEVRKGPDEMRLDPMTNPSDHRAVVVDVTTRSARSVAVADAFKDLKEFVNKLHQISDAIENT